jgi:hypothetical protein
MANEPNPTRIPGDVDEGFSNSLENREARTQMRRENAAASLPKGAIRAAERKRGARK